MNSVDLCPLFDELGTFVANKEVIKAAKSRCNEQEVKQEVEEVDEVDEVVEVVEVVEVEEVSQLLQLIHITWIMLDLLESGVGQ